MSAYSTVIQVRFGHVDPAGIAYFPASSTTSTTSSRRSGRCTWGLRYYHLLPRSAWASSYSEVDFRKPAVR